MRDATLVGQATSSFWASSVSQSEEKSVIMVSARASSSEVWMT